MPNSYQERSRDSLALATKHLAKGSLRQASGKGWDAVCQMTRAVAKERGWKYGNRTLLFRVVDRLAVETEERQLIVDFLSARALDWNRYEGWMDRGNVEGGMRQVKRFVNRLEALLD